MDFKDGRGILIGITDERDLRMATDNINGITDEMDLRMVAEY